MVKVALQNEGIKLQHTLTEEEELTVLAREVKQHKDSLLEFKKLVVKTLLINCKVKFRF